MSLLDSNYLTPDGPNVKFLCRCFNDPPEKVLAFYSREFICRDEMTSEHLFQDLVSSALYASPTNSNEGAYAFLVGVYHVYTLIGERVSAFSEKRVDLEAPFKMADTLGMPDVGKTLKELYEVVKMVMELKPDQELGSGFTVRIPKF